MPRIASVMEKGPTMKNTGDEDHNGNHFNE